MRLGDEPLPRRPVIEEDAVGVRRDDQDVGAQVAREDGGRTVLVDDGLDAREDASGRVVHRRDSPAARADDQEARREQQVDAGHLEDALRRRRRNDPPPGLAVRLDHPAVLGRQPLGLRAGVDGADELRRVAERGIVGRDLGQREHGDDVLLERHDVAEFLLDQVADDALGRGAEDVEGVAGLGVEAGRLQREQPHLRAVAVGDHDVVASAGHRPDGLGRQPDVLTLAGDGHRLPAPGQGVAAQGDHDSHLSSSSDADRSGRIPHRFNLAGRQYGQRRPMRSAYDRTG